MKELDGDLIDLALAGRFDVLVHGCNCFNTMGSGLALQVKKRLPLAYEADQQTRKGDPAKLGTYSHAQVRRRDGTALTVVNAYIQFQYGHGARHANYDAIRSVFERIRADFEGQRIGYPQIGAGLAGGDWFVIRGIIDDVLQGADHTLVNYMPRAGGVPHERGRSHAFNLFRPRS